MSEQIIIDAHLHLFRERQDGQRAKEGYEIWEYGIKSDVCFSNYDGNKEDALEAIKDAEVNRVVVVNLFVAAEARTRFAGELNADMNETQKEEAERTIIKILGEELKSSNAWVCDIARVHPQFVPFICLDPWLLSVEEAETHVRDMVENYGAKGIKVHPVGQAFYLKDKRMQPVIRVCVELNLPIVTHSGPSREGEPFAEPSSFAEVLEAFPGLRLVLAHMGGGTWRQLRDVASEYQNVYFDCSEIIEWTGSTNGPSERELAQLILDVGSERVMMGSDFPWYDISHNVERVMELPLLSKEQKDDILGANALRILNF